MVMVKKKNQQKYLEKKYIFFSCRQRWLTMWKLFFPCTAAERGTSEETFNLKSINTATENGIKSALSCSLNKKHRFPIQLYDRFLEAGIKASACTHGDQNGALKLAWVTIIYTRVERLNFKIFFSCYRKYFHCCQLPTNILYLLVLLQFLTYLKEIIWR